MRSQESRVKGQTRLFGQTKKHSRMTNPYVYWTFGVSPWIGVIVIKYVLGDVRCVG